MPSEESCEATAEQRGAGNRGAETRANHRPGGPQGKVAIPYLVRSSLLSDGRSRRLPHQSSQATVTSPSSPTAGKKGTGLGSGR